MSDWKNQRLGIGYLIGAEKRQVRVGKPSEYVGVIRLYDGADTNDEVILTRRDLLFLVDSLDYHGVDVLPLRMRMHRRLSSSPVPKEPKP